ncbi:disease resistance protein [Vigna angularis]|uniref:Disease resistance protein n=2 Tax=Phaseolus angularis TaxID=3914 RepID=A0A8T0JQX1_PHAAN|nr:putative disease resistance protein At5g47280 [Vigna angularis]KAG2380582.1 disease resistance protein [Vigna angularis]BAT97589.1 hypothetical protein VIGAN_09108400 [Vigna angularis var. angularis]
MISKRPPKQWPNGESSYPSTSLLSSTACRFSSSSSPCSPTGPPPSASESITASATASEKCQGLGLGVSVDPKPKPVYEMGVGYFRERILFLTVSQSPNVEQLRTKIWGYIMGNERLDSNYVVPQWVPQFECKSEGARTLIVLDDLWTFSVMEQSVIEQLVCRIPGCKYLVVSRTKFQTELLSMGENNRCCFS